MNDYLFRRTPDWDKNLTKDRKPWSMEYNGMYKTRPWDAFTGTTHTYDKVFVTRPNDNGCWDPVDITSCVSAPCAPSRNYVCWGSDRLTYSKYHRDYQTPVLCYDQMRDTEMASEQIAAIVEGLKKMPDNIISDFTRLFALRSANKIWIAGSADTQLTVTSSMFTNNCTRLDLGGTGNLPTSKLTIGYLDNHMLDLQFQGYFENAFTPQGKFSVMTDLQTWRDIANNNPALAQMYTSADFEKGGAYYKYGVMSGVGNWLFRPDSTPLRYQHIGNGVLQRLQPYQNVAATVGKKPEYDPAYKNAQYQISHVYNAAARTAYAGTAPEIGSGTQFGPRNFNGRWSWHTPDVIIYTDPNTGVQCTIQNDKHNQGYFLGEYEMGFKTEYPEIEMMILHQVEAQPIVNNPRCAAEAATATQTLTPYCLGCGDS
jgi:hypothetical protein